MKKCFLSAIIFLIASSIYAQSGAEKFYSQQILASTPVKSQDNTGTCWSFATTSMLESQCLKKGLQHPVLSEMFTVRNIYLEKAHNYLLRQGHAQFSEGGLAHDVVRSYSLYGAIPEDVYNGLLPGVKTYDHQAMVAALQKYLDSILKIIPLPENWINGYTKILDDNLGVPPSVFTYNGKEYTPISFAKDYMKFKKDDYVDITSFTHQPYYQPFVLQVPDNFSNGEYYNVPLKQMIEIVEEALRKGYSVSWDADVSNDGFLPKKGLALLIDRKMNPDSVNADIKEDEWNADKRQTLYENLTTQDDHLMHIVGIEKTKSGKKFFVVKNSWGKVGPYNGFINVSESYFAINTISLVVPKDGISRELLMKMGIK